MNYITARTIIKTGDIIGCEGNGFILLAIRKLTGQSLNHVAMFVWIEEGLYIFEFVEGTGFQFKPASIWMNKRLKKQERLYWGRAPDLVSNQPKQILSYVSKVRNGKRTDRNYNYWELPVLWASQYFNFTIEALSGVCSTSISHAWKTTGYKFKKYPRPGDYLYLCKDVTAIHTLDGED